MKIQKARKLQTYTIFLVILGVINTIYIPVVRAQSQSAELPLTVSSDDPHINSDVNSSTITGLGVATPGGNTVSGTPRDDASLITGPNAYTWRVDLSGICTGAQLKSLKIVTQSDTTDEEPTSGIFLGVYGTSNLTMFDSYSINGGMGEDSNPWISPMFGTPGPVVDRGKTGTTGPFTTFPADLGMEGELNATWDLTNVNRQEPLGIYIQHWLSGDLTTAQTTIESITLSYDDAGCATTPTIAPSQSLSTLAATGQNQLPIFLLVALLTLPAVTYIARRRLLR